MIRKSTTIQGEDITIANTYAPNIRAPQYIRQTLIDIKEKLTVIQLSRALKHPIYTNGSIIKTEYS